MTKEKQNILIRKMELQDVPRISKMFLEQGWAPRDMVLENYVKEQNEGIRIGFVAEIEKQIAGYVTLMVLAKHGPFANTYPEVSDFNVFEKYQKLGIGNQLLDEVEKEAKAISEVITLGVGLHKGYGPAQRIYVKRGYIPDGTGVWYQNKNIDNNEPCFNDDDLALYLSKKLN